MFPSTDTTSVVQALRADDETEVLSNSAIVSATVLVFPLPRVIA